ncbi:hypothetical protein CEE45_13475 [Candidatus Heimdallarchaeota archaeon B3_Heim]|nr:MAG: hypothetical protein CEE45_13475 [Candidatus Heimdallarchaeota archaeon B3_Heim]
MLFKEKIQSIKLKYVLLFHTVVALSFGISFIFFPEILLPMLTISVETGSLYGFRLFGSVVLGVALLAFCIRNEEPSSARQSVLLFFVFGFFIMTIIHFLYADLTNLMNWSIIIMHLGFVLVYGYFFYRNR